MKLNAAGFTRFLSRPDSSIYAALIFGNDLGQVSERVSALKKAWLGETGDPFSKTVFSTGQLVAQDGSLADELNAFSMSGGARLVHLKHPQPDESKAVIAVLKSFDTDIVEPVAHLIIEAGSLAASSALRKSFETSKSHALALACYPDQAGDVAGFARQTLQDAGYTIQPDALNLLVDSIPRDRRILRMELEKLLCYLEDQPGLCIEPPHVSAIITQAGDASLDDLVFASTSGQKALADIALQRALDAGQAPVMIVRAIARHLYRLSEVLAQVQKGTSIGPAIAKLRPPVFIMHRDRFTRQCQSWSPSRLQSALNQTIETERALKSNTGSPNSRLGRLLLAISSISN